jgi:uncharacterized protein YjbJ (UPF0337 family)
MNWKHENSWDQIKNKIVSQWNKLTEDDVTKIHGKREQLVSSLQNTYHLTSEQAESQVCDFEKKCDSSAKDDEGCCGSDKKESTSKIKSNPRETTL